VGRNAHVFPKLAIVRILDLRKIGPISGACRKGEKAGGNEVKEEKKTDLVEVVLVELADE
jgi:hypothetical protein